ncbi:hypothetical protein CK203_085797 [Vitis vinifera]|uniref:Small ribosomal subunit protein mS23 n=1 Tax=Vitis vinifera TaxID=29760 RepID=A0A438E368_VITVI|nr:hypothetical protein CK203_085797 [Vitis vinifera]
MSYMKGDMLTRTRKLVKGLAKAEPSWLKAMERVPPPTFPRPDGKVKKIVSPRMMTAFNPPPARVFGCRVLELKKRDAIKEIQAEERKYVRDRFFDPKILKIVEKMKEEKAAVMQDRMRGGGW